MQYALDECYCNGNRLAENGKVINVKGETGINLCTKT